MIPSMRGVGTQMLLNGLQRVCVARRPGAAEWAYLQLEILIRSFVWRTFRIDAEGSSGASNKRWVVVTRGGASGCLEIGFDGSDLEGAVRPRVCVRMRTALKVRVTRVHERHSD